MGKHKPDCAVFAPTLDGYSLHCTCGADATEKVQPGPPPEDCPDCDGAGQQINMAAGPQIGVIRDCPACHGTGIRQDATKKSQPAPCRLCGGAKASVPCPVCGGVREPAPAPLPGEVEDALSRMEECAESGEFSMRHFEDIGTVVESYRLLHAQCTDLTRRLAEAEAELQEKCEDCHHKSDFEQHLAGCAMERDRILRAGLVDECDCGGGLWRNARAEAAEARVRRLEVDNAGRFDHIVKVEAERDALREAAARLHGLNIGASPAGCALEAAFPEAFAGEADKPEGWTFWKCGVCGAERPDCVTPVQDEECGDACPEHYEAGEVGRG